jgi:hypothetical protein
VDHAIKHARELQEKKKAKDWRVKKSELKEKLKTLSVYKKDLQVLFNRWIRLTKEPTCISCDKDLRNVKFDCGHYRTAGGNPALRYEPLNCWPQCVQCNRDFHGNILEYRKRLLVKIGIEKLDWLESDHEPKKYSIEEIKEMIKDYRLKLKDITQKAP